MAGGRKPRRRKSGSQVAGTKVDPRLALLLSWSDKKLLAFKADEEARLAELLREIADVVAALVRPEEQERKATLDRLRELKAQMFGPLTTGVYAQASGDSERQWPTSMGEPFASVFILCDASADDLLRLGVHVRSQAGDIFTAFVPLSLIPRLEKLTAIRYIELTRPVFRALDEAVPYAKIDQLHNANPSVDGTGVIVGIVDTTLDIYHDDFRTAQGSRVLFLWDQTLTAQLGEMPPPTDPALPGFIPTGGDSYGVEYDKDAINDELSNAAVAYQIVRHGGEVSAHGTHVAGIAAGNGRGQNGTYIGAAPGSDIIFVRQGMVIGDGTGPIAVSAIGDTVGLADAFAYVFARAAALAQPKPCVVNMSAGHNLGPHDGTSLCERFLDDLLLTPGRAITLAAGNQTGSGIHASGTVGQGATTNLLLSHPLSAMKSEAIEIWYDGVDRVEVTVTVPTFAAIGPVAPGGSAAGGSNQVKVDVRSIVNHPLNGDNLISIVFIVAAGSKIPSGDTVIGLVGKSIVNGSFDAWIDGNNQSQSRFRPPHVQNARLTVQVPGTASRPLTVGAHDKALPPAIYTSSGSGPSRDARIKPELATVGVDVMAPLSLNRVGSAGSSYISKDGTSQAAPLVAGVCACIFQCRGPTATWADLKQILEDGALAPPGVAIPDHQFGFGYMQAGSCCGEPAAGVDVWLRDDSTDTGLQPSTGSFGWLSPDIEVLDAGGTWVPNPTFDAANRFNNIIQVTVRNRGTNTARNTEVFLYWADPSTNLSYPSAWNTTGIYTDPPAYSNQSNKAVIAQIGAGASTQVQFGWSPPAPGANISGDDHFCLIVRVENEQDPSQVGVGEWATIRARNNIAMRNIHVQLSGQSQSQMRFFVAGSAHQDSIVVYPMLRSGRVSLWMPIQVLPWRDMDLINRNGGPRLRFGSDAIDLLAAAEATLQGRAVSMVTGIIGADLLELRDGIARVTWDSANALRVPDVRIAEGARAIMKVLVDNPQTESNLRFVHIAQLSGGQRVGGVSMELRATATASTGQRPGSNG